eukprot:Hpha_TRINITY_DN7224_c0_g1::TRINITY_DN7224_c0_g1_i1::g.102153::m.102153/K17290/HTATIP2; oxidoreductase
MCACLTAAVAGATGATGRALVALLSAERRVGKVLALSRRDVDVASEFGNAFAKVAGSSPDKVKAVKVEDWAAPLEGEKVDLGFTCMGTSRANAEVKSEMEGKGADAGFAQWLQTVDVGHNVAFAKAAVASGAKYVGRVSASKADSSNEGTGFHVYFKHQGLCDDAYQQAGWRVPVGLFRPGPLGRGDMEREWEKGKQSTPVEVVAGAMLKDALDRAVDQATPQEPLVRIFDVPTIVAMGSPAVSQ